MNKLTEAYNHLRAKLLYGESSKTNINVDILKKNEGEGVSVFDDIRITNAKSGETWTISRKLVPAETEEEKMYGRDYTTTLKDGSGVTLDTFRGYVSDSKVPLIEYSDKNPYAKIYAMANREIKIQHDKFMKDQRNKEQKGIVAESVAAKNKIDSFFSGRNK